MAKKRYGVYLDSRIAWVGGEVAKRHHRSFSNYLECLIRRNIGIGDGKVIEQEHIPEVLPEASEVKSFLDDLSLDDIDAKGMKRGRVF